MIRHCAPAVSLNSRTFSIAITAWAAKVFTSSICLSVNRSYFHAATHHDCADHHALPQQRCGQRGANPFSLGYGYCLHGNSVCSPQSNKSLNMNRVCAIKNGIGQTTEPDDRWDAGAGSGLDSCRSAPRPSNHYLRRRRIECVGCTAHSSQRSPRSYPAPAECSSASWQ